MSRFGYSDCKLAATPYDLSGLLLENQGIAREQLRYSQIINSLVYLASATRSDISVVSKLNRIFLKFRRGPLACPWEGITLSKRDYELWYSLYQLPEGTWGLLWCKLDIWCWWDLCHRWICILTWRWRCFIEVLQVDHLNEVNNGSITHSIRYRHNWSWVTSWTPYGFTGSWKTDTDYFHELW